MNNKSKVGLAKIFHFSIWTLLVVISLFAFGCGGAVPSQQTKGIAQVLAIRGNKPTELVVQGTGVYSLRNAAIILAGQGYYNPDLKLKIINCPTKEAEIREVFARITTNENIVFQ